MLAFGGQGISGEVDATADIRGPLELPHVDAQFSIQEGALRGFRYASLTGTVESTTGGFEFSTRLQQTQDAWLTAEGRVPRSLLGGDRTAADADIEVTVESSPIALGFVSGLTDIVGDVQGTIQANVRVTGTPERPAFDGEVAIRDGAFLVPALGTSFTGLDTTIVFEPDAMVVPEFRLLDENGESLRFAGRLPYEAAGEGVAITVDSQNFELVDNAAADIQISTNLMITGTLVAPRFEGTVRVTDGEIRVDRILDLRQGSYYRVEPLEASNGSAESVARDRVGDASAGIMQDTPVALDITLELPALLITGQNLRGPSAVPIGLGDVNLTVEGMLQLDKAIGEALILTGDISTVRGAYEFQGRRFDILRDGRIQFPGLVEINPLLDVTAQRTISGVEAQVHIAGTLRQPELTLSSQPPLDQADILSLIVFNQPANQLGAADQVSLGQRAAALATGFVASKLAESLGGVLDLDVLRIEAGDSAVRGLAPSVTVGEQVGERLFLRLRQQFGPSSTSQLALEYEFAEWLRLQTTVSDESTPTQSPFTRGEQTGLNWIFSFSY
jgi:translocation and assembly module TamB